jgi:8-oxo-dGTP pyrophosphatase MutT (NUDIX family)
VVYRDCPDGIELLLVRASRDPTRWVWPKGHVEDGETDEEAALREVREEAGVDSRIQAKLGQYSFPKQRESVRVVMFLAEFQSLVERSESREVQWMDLEQARRALSFEDARLVLDRARELIQPGRVTDQ